MESAKSELQIQAKAIGQNHLIKHELSLNQGAQDQANESVTQAQVYSGPFTQRWCGWEFVTVMYRLGWSNPTPKPRKSLLVIAGT